MTNLIALPAGTVLVGDYRVQRVLGAGGFGVTYLADEIALSRVVTLKEYFPSDFAARTDGVEAAPRSGDCAGDFKWGLDRFIEEAQTLAKFDHPNIVRVYRYFRANSTAYMVLQFEQGQSLKAWLKGLGRAPRQKELDGIIGPLLDALEFIHRADFLHRDIAPDNIIIRKDGAPVLIDFGSARGEIAAHSKTVSALVKPGYSPYEQYAETSRQQGPWSDIYALAATLYHAVTGKRPPDSPSRVLKDEYVSVRESALGSYRAGFLNAIDKALQINVEARPQSVAAWRGDLLAPDPPKPSWLTRGKNAKQPAEALELAGAGAPVAAAPPSGLVPPPPDAPGPQGGLLDFFDALKRSKTPVAAAVAEAPPPPPAAKPRTPLKQKLKEAEGKGGAAKAEAKPKVRKPVTAAKVTAAKANAAKTSAVKPPAVKAAVVKTAPVKTAAKASVAEKRAPAAAPARPRPVVSQPRRSRARLVGQAILGLGAAGVALLFLQPWPKAPQNPKAAAIVMPQDIPVMVKEFKAHDGDVSGVAFTADGRNIVSASKDATLKVWGTTGGLQKTISLDNRLVTSLSLNGRRAVTGHGDGSVLVYDLDVGTRIGPFKRNESEVWSVTFLGSPDRFAAGSHDYNTAVWDVKTPGQPQFLLSGHESAVQAVAFTEYGPWIATGSADKTVRLYDANTQELQRVFKGPKDFVTSLAFAPDGKSIAIASLDGSIRVYGTQSGRLLRQLTGHKTRIGALAYSPDGSVLASGADEGIVRLWDAKRGRTLRSLGGHAGGAKALGFSPDGSRLVSTGADGMIRLWSVPPVKSRD